MNIFGDLSAQVQVLKKSRLFNEGLTLFSIMRDEHYFIPHFLSHYRRLGVTNFVIYADRCDSHFMASLESEDDVTVVGSQTLKFSDAFGPPENPSVRRLGSVLRETFSNEFAKGRWHVVVDADEFLVLPPPFTTIPDYTAYLDARGLGYSFAPMVDFDPQRLSDRNFGYQTNPFMGAPFFDKGPYHLADTESGKVIITTKGLRWRLLRTLWKYRRQLLIDLGLDLSKVRYERLDAKHPILKTSDDLQRVGSHEISITSDLTHGCVLCHFKFYPQLDEKIDVAIRERQYNANSREYVLMKLMLEHIGNANLVSTTTMRYTGVEDLVAGGFLNRLA